MVCKIKGVRNLSEGFLTPLRLLVRLRTKPEVEPPRVQIVMPQWRLDPATFRCEETAAKFMSEFCRLRDEVRYSEAQNCEWFFRHCFTLWDLELIGSLYQIRHDFKLVDKPQFMDAVVFRQALYSKRHLGVMLDHRWFLHCSQATNGVGRSDLSRGYDKRVAVFARHHAFTSGTNGTDS